VLAAQEGPGPSRDRLVETVLPYIASVAQLVPAGRAVDLSELVHQGVAGLLRALARYDPTLGTPFRGYAMWWVRHAMQQPAAELTVPLAGWHGPLRELARARDAQRHFFRLHGRAPTPDKLASAAAITQDQAIRLLAAERRPGAFDGLSDAERTIVRGRYGLDGHVFAVSELADSLGVSSDRVHDIELQALAKLGAPAC
jgi:RNA polymerase sigma factor (sigma-70 family)